MCISWTIKGLISLMHGITKKIGAASYLSQTSVTYHRLRKSVIVKSDVMYDVLNHSWDITGISQGTVLIFV